MRAQLDIVRLPFPFIGLMGGRRKIERIFAALRAEGVPPEMIEAIHTPVGLGRGSDTPAENALSVAAQLLRERSRG